MIDKEFYNDADFEQKYTSLVLERQILDWRTYSCSGSHVAIIAKRGAADDWAVYVGALPHPCTREELIAHTAKWGGKMLERDARAMFPKIELEYRR